MKKFHYQQQDRRTPAQISSDLAARMSRVDKQMETGVSKTGESEGEISPESVDFGSVLKSVSSQNPSPLPEVLAQASAKATSGNVHRYRNLSSVIEMIRDEGPAGEEAPAELAEDVLDLSTPAETGTAEEPETPVPPTETSRLAAGEQGASSVGSFLKVVVISLVVAISGMAFLAWQQMQRQGELEAKLKATQQMLGHLDERYRALEARTAAVASLDSDRVDRAEFDQALAGLRQQFADELLLFTVLLAPRIPKSIEPERVGSETVVKPERAKTGVQPAPARKPAGKPPVEAAQSGGVRV
ncbi:MAG TPA: hypothetical protein EYP90_05890, partial [Chromatiaceae bacterium]|nr:hypothetical protein [Chromatiaceae bacterium]